MGKVVLVAKLLCCVCWRRPTRNHQSLCGAAFLLGLNAEASCRRMVNSATARKLSQGAKNVNTCLVVLEKLAW